MHPARAGAGFVLGRLRLPERGDMRRRLMYAAVTQCPRRLAALPKKMRGAFERSAAQRGTTGWMQGFGPRLRLISALAWAVVALGGSAPAQAQDAFVLEIDGPETTLVTQTIREEIARLGAPPSGRLSVTRAAGVATVTYVAADGRVI